ncbi:hypothetical protein GZH49_01650 [Nocardia terpenica]|uniref:DUF6968 family protein n=1 Tax=Nocardia terpenica TaxID=455432 RepID=UPI002FE2E199
MTSIDLNDYGEFGDPIATRELISGETGGPVVVDIGAPRPHPAGWVCPYRITGIESEPITRGVPGVDSMQALQDAVLIVGDVLASTGHPVTFHGGEPGLRRLSDR